MTIIRSIALSSLAIVLASCAGKSNNYDTSNPYGTADYGSNTPLQPIAPVNPVYDTPAAYEEAGNLPPAPSVPEPAFNTPTRPAGSPAAGPGTVHVVVKGDTLSGLAGKYKVSVASIKQANNLTKDVIILGQKLRIPAN